MAVHRIEPEKTSRVNEAKNFLVSNPTCPSAPYLHSKADDVNKKYNNLEQLLQCSQEKYDPKSLTIINWLATSSWCILPSTWGQLNIMRISCSDDGWVDMKYFSLSHLLHQYC